jgi:flagellar biosynthesis anti-sigma factor FlgM
MRIDPSHQYLGNISPENVGNAQGQPKIPSSRVTGGNTPDFQAADAGDTVQFSGSLSELQQLKAQLTGMPDVRASRVTALQQQMQQGTYQPSNEAIANAMLNDLFGPGSQQ